MSWTESFSNLTADELEVLEPKNEQSKNEQFKAARNALCELAQSGCLGDPETTKFSGHLSGHENKNNEPLPGWARDQVNISLLNAKQRTHADMVAE